LSQQLPDRLIEQVTPLFVSNSWNCSLVGSCGLPLGLG
jgi:hypothetical protein